MQQSLICTVAILSLASLLLVLLVLLTGLAPPGWVAWLLLAAGVAGGLVLRGGRRVDLRSWLRWLWSDERGD